MSLYGMALAFSEISSILANKKLLRHEKDCSFADDNITDDDWMR